MLPPAGASDAARAFRARPGKAHPNNEPPAITAVTRVKNNRLFMVVFSCAPFIGAPFIGGTRCSTRDRV